MNRLSKKWCKEIPPIQALVVQSGKSVPGSGFDPFLQERGKVWNTPQEREAILKTYIAEIVHYPYWMAVLAEIGLKPAASTIEDVILSATSFRGGEGPEHKALKEYVKSYPECVDLPFCSAMGSVEAPLPSGDSIDVLFDCRDLIIAVEVKPATSPIHDIARGLFQCVKYRAVLQARADFTGDPRSIDSYLVIGGNLPNALIALRNSLGVSVFERVG